MRVRLLRPVGPIRRPVSVAPIAPAILILVTLASAALTGCSVDYEPGTRDTSGDEEEPNELVMRTVTLRTVTGNGVSLMIAADTSRTNRDEMRQVLDRAYFLEYAPDGTPRTEGIADRVTLDLDTENAELDGNVQVYSTEEDASVSAQYLYWNNADRVLESRVDEAIAVERGDGTEMEGQGFRADATTRRLVFTRGVAGVLVLEDDEAENDEP